MTQDLLISHDEGVTTLTIARPPLNLLTLPMLEQMVAALEDLQHRNATRVIVLTALGERAFGVHEL